MARKPPPYIYGHDVTLRVCVGVDLFQNPLWEDHEISGVNLQASSGTVLTALNVDASKRSLMFVDSLYSSPQLDWLKLKRESENAGKRMQIVHGDAVYNVEAVDRIEDQFCRLDHWEVELV